MLSARARSQAQSCYIGSSGEQEKLVWVMLSSILALVYSTLDLEVHPCICSVLAPSRNVSKRVHKRKQEAQVGQSGSGF